MVSKIALAKIDEIPEEGSKTVTASDGTEVALFKLEGKIFAIENVCPHRGGPIGEGEIENGCVTCPWHGWQFDIKTCNNVEKGQEAATKIDILVEGDTIFLNE